MVHNHFAPLLFVRIVRHRGQEVDGKEKLVLEAQHVIIDSSASSTD